MPYKKLFNPDYLRHLANQCGLRPSKKYGQNFLIDPASIEQMINAAEINKDDTVVEIGPGFGALTFMLVEKAKKVFAFEIEKKLQSYWSSLGQSGRISNLQIEWGNILRLGDRGIARLGNYKVVANLPYQITSAVIRYFLENANPPGSMIIMVQKEVAERICAKPGKLSLLAISVQYYGQPEIMAIVPRVSFWPEPAVDSAIIRIVIPVKFIRRRGETANLTERDWDFDRHFFKVVKAGFSSKRKKLLTNLSNILQSADQKKQLRQYFLNQGLTENVRAQELSIDQWRELSLVIH